MDGKTVLDLSDDEFINELSLKPLQVPYTHTHTHEHNPLFSRSLTVSLPLCFPCALPFARLIFLSPSLASTHKPHSYNPTTTSCLLLTQFEQVNKLASLLHLCSSSSVLFFSSTHPSDSVLHAAVELTTYYVCRCEGCARSLKPYFKSRSWGQPAWAYTVSPQLRKRVNRNQDFQLAEFPCRIYI